MESRGGDGLDEEDVLDVACCRCRWRRVKKHVVKALPRMAPTAILLSMDKICGTHASMDESKKANDTHCSQKRGGGEI